ncbi:K(+)-transporting ATPase subunit C [Arachidicoccus sp.]|uniref:K(+)-transporting ATPase subunit C n=1 Tax=Arachidicoccus sp. TaxID=1872624 RepID=UPI003D23B128
MKSHIFPGIRLTLICLIFFVGVYSVTIYGIAQFTPNRGKGEIVIQNGKTYYSNIGQQFTEDKYFYSRPSAVNYNAASSGASNKSTINSDYLKQVQARIDTFLIHNPGIEKSAIPSDIVTASGSGLDPNISVQAAEIQIKRIAKIRGITEEKLEQLVRSNIEKPFLGLFGTEKINLLKLNLALDNLK